MQSCVLCALDYQRHKTKDFDNHTRHSSNGNLLRRVETTPVSQRGGFAPVEV
jgi:hypothetical protein